MQPPLEVWVPRDPHLAGQQKSWDSELQKCHMFIRRPPLAPRDREEGTHTPIHGNQKPGLPLPGRGQNWLILHRELQGPHPTLC